MSRNLPLSILIILFLGLMVMRQIKSSSNVSEQQLVELLSQQGYQAVTVTNSDFGYCPRLLEIPVRFQASLQNKLIEGIACFSALNSASPRIQFKN